MNISKSTENGQTVLKLNGRLDTTTAPDFQDTLLGEIKTGKSIMTGFSDILTIESA